MAEPRSETMLRGPGELLAPYVEQYVGYRLSGFPPGIHRGLPSRHLTFIVGIGPTIEVVAQTDPRESPRSYHSVLGGLQPGPALIAHSGNQEGIAIQLTPHGCRALFGLPASGLWNTSVELDEVVGPVGVELWERLQATGDWSERFAICDGVLGRLVVERRRGLAPELHRAWYLLERSGGMLTVQDLASEVGWSRQHLARCFGREFGLSPKLAARVMRFEVARHRLVSVGPAESIATVAASCGYYDQAHLAREFAELAGCSPTALLAEDLPSVQDPDLSTGGRSTHEHTHR